MVKIKNLNKELSLEKFIRWQLKRYSKFKDPFLSKSDLLIGLFDFFCYFDNNIYVINGIESTLFTHIVEGRFIFGYTKYITENSSVELVMQIPGRLSGTHLRKSLASGEKFDNSLVSNFAFKYYFGVNVFKSKIKSVVLHLDSNLYSEMSEGITIDTIRSKHTQGILGFYIPSEVNFLASNRVKHVYFLNDVPKQQETLFEDTEPYRL